MVPLAVSSMLPERLSVRPASASQRLLADTGVVVAVRIAALRAGAATDMDEEAAYRVGIEREVSLSIRGGAQGLLGSIHGDGDASQRHIQRGAACPLAGFAGKDTPADGCACDWSDAERVKAGG